MCCKGGKTILCPNVEYVETSFVKCVKLFSNGIEPNSMALSGVIFPLPISP